LGLALDEPDSSFYVSESNGIKVYIQPTLSEQLKLMGGVIIDFIDEGPDQRGFVVNTRMKSGHSDCSSGGCGGKGCHEEPQ